MLHLFCPNYRCRRISEIPVAWLKQEGIEAIILDLDNTLLPWDESIPSEENVSWVQKVKEAEIRWFFYPIMVDGCRISVK